MIMSSSYTKHNKHSYNKQNFLKIAVSVAQKSNMIDTHRPVFLKAE